mmetsp:Transcript_9825/g.29411  ORF Transcript_9825/g.29411 Transcript_9825/m.29411 type:complete len:239 (-) Transcript_9825:25-741(-)
MQLRVSLLSRHRGGGALHRPNGACLCRREGDANREAPPAESQRGHSAPAGPALPVAHRGRGAGLRASSLVAPGPGHVLHRRAAAVRWRVGHGGRGGQPAGLQRRPLRLGLLLLQGHRAAGGRGLRGAGVLLHRVRHEIRGIRTLRPMRAGDHGPSASAPSGGGPWSRVRSGSRRGLWGSAGAASTAARLCCNTGLQRGVPTAGPCANTDDAAPPAHMAFLGRRRWPAAQHGRAAASPA